MGAPFCLPRMRGDRPFKLRFRRVVFAFTPHARGSTLASDYPKGGTPVYPACAGIDRFQTI